MFNFGKPIEPREPIRVAEALQPLDCGDTDYLDEKFLNNQFFKIFCEDVEDSED